MSELSKKDTNNAIAILAISLVTVVAATVWLTRPREEAKDFQDDLSERYVIVYNLAISGLASGVLISTYLEQAPLGVQYRVSGRPEIPEVQYEFNHGGRWTTFTLWCNTLGLVYFWLASLVGGLNMVSSTPSAFHLALNSVVHVLWEIVYPMAFLVNLVVTFVLIPGIKHAGMLDKLKIILTWRPQALHNGFVLAVAVEAALAAPCMNLHHFCVVVLFGLTYVVFAYGLYLRTGIFHYFFLDHRFDGAPIALISLLVLLGTLYLVGYMVLQRASESLFWKGVLLLCALGTCTFSDPALSKQRAEARDD